MRDYITEKLINGLKCGTIPIVLSHKDTPDYTLFLPKSAYININDFENLDNFYAHLMNISTNFTL